jgi:hypothetical protein
LEFLLDSQDTEPAKHIPDPRADRDSGYVPDSDSELHSGCVPPCISVCEPEIVDDEAFEEIIEFLEAEQVRRHLLCLSLDHGDQERNVGNQHLEKELDCSQEEDLNDGDSNNGNEDPVHEDLGCGRVPLSDDGTIVDTSDVDKSRTSLRDEYGKMADILKNETGGNKRSESLFNFGIGTSEFERTVETILFF